MYKEGNMNIFGKFQYLSSILVMLSILTSGCATTLVKDNVSQTEASVSHCSGSESVDDSSIAVLPIPIVAFFVPHVDLHEVRGDEYLKRCGESTQLINRSVKVNRIGCIPASLTRIITLGIWQWCPTNVSWEADVKSP